MEVLKFNHDRLKNVRLITFTNMVDVNEFYADFLIKNNRIFNYLQEKDISESKKYLRDVLLQKITLMDRQTKIKNDGVMMPFLSFELIQQHYNVDVLYLFSDEDVEKSKFGLDSVFVGKDVLFIVEYKSRQNKCNENDISKAINEAVISLFGKDSYDLATLKYCRKNLNTLTLDNPQKIEDLIDYYQKNNYNPEKLIDKEGLSMNICIVSPVNEFNPKTLETYILQKYFQCDACPKCKEFRCPKYEKIKINDVIHIQLSKEFNLKEFYKCLISRLEG